MKKTILTSTAVIALSGFSQAATLATIDFDNLSAVVDATDELTGSQVISITIADGGVTFTANATISGVQVNGGSNIMYGNQDVGGSQEGYILMRSSTGNDTVEKNMSEITITLGSFLQTSGTPGATIQFDGLTSFTNSNLVSNRTIVIGSQSYSGLSDSSTIAVTSLTGTNPYSDSELAVKIDSTAGANWRLHEVAAQFTINPVPEPSSAALLGLGGLALILRRHK